MLLRHLVMKLWHVTYHRHRHTHTTRGRVMRCESSPRHVVRDVARVQGDTCYQPQLSLTTLIVTIRMVLTDVQH
jgi:hypothetical protein